MSWIGITDLQTAQFDQRGIGKHVGFGDFEPGDGIMPVGSLVIEVTYAAQSRIPQRILRYERTHGWLRRFSIVLSANGELEVTNQQGDATAVARLTIQVPPRETRLRITYSWDAPGRTGVVSVENLTQEEINQAEFDAPLPVPVEDIWEMIHNGPATRIGIETRYLAVSDAVEPVGLTPGVAKGTPVETPSGPCLIERLRLGDLVTTAANGPQPVRWIVKREVPALGGFRPIRLRAPYFGLSRDILAAPDHRLVVTGADAEYLFGEDSVLTASAHLIDGSIVRREKSSDTIWYYHLLLDRHECLQYAGLWGESLFVGSIARFPEVVATTSLAEMPASAIPRHRQFARPILSDVEARTLAAAMRA